MESALVPYATSALSNLVGGKAAEVATSAVAPVISNAVAQAGAKALPGAAAGTTPLQKLLGSGGVSVAGDLPVRHISTADFTSSATPLDSMTTNHNGTHSGALYFSNKYSKAPTLGSGTEQSRVFGNLKGQKMLDLSNPDAAAALGDIYEQGYAKLGDSYNQGAAKQMASDLRKGVTEAFNDRNGVVRNALGDIGIIKGKSATGEDEFLIINDDILKKINPYVRKTGSVPSPAVINPQAFNPTTGMGHVDLSGLNQYLK